MKKNSKKVFLFDWRFKLGIIIFILSMTTLVVGVILVSASNFITNNGIETGNGWIIIKANNINTLLFHWIELDDTAIKNLDISHPYQNIFAALIMLLFIAPILLVLSIMLIARWFFKTRI